MGIEGDADFRPCQRQLNSPKIDGGYFSSTRPDDGDERNPTYTPIMAESWAGGTNGNTINTTNFNPRGSTSTATYSNDITAPFGEATTGRFTIPEGDRNFGGNFADLFNGITVNEGDTMFIRWYNYFPSAFCAGYQLGTGEGSDGYGSTKWIRLGFAPTGQRLTFQLGNFSNSACAASHNIHHISDEIGGSGQQSWGSTPTISRDAWVAMQMSIYFSTNSSLGYSRLWVGSTYIGQTANFQTLPSSDNVLNDLTVGDYWNGASQAANTWYMDEIIVTTDTPNTTDAGGRPYIHPDTRVSDFA